MASLIYIMLIVSCVFITTIPRGSVHARRQLAAEKEEATSFIQNICGGNEKLTMIHFYVQDVLDGPNPTVYEVARASITSNSPTGFGQVRVLDDVVTAGPESNSTTLGRAQGLITFSDLQVSALTMDLNIVFTSGKYNGSTICILGRNQINDEKRELAVVGGTGVFRFARGYAFSSTYSYDIEINYGVLEYTIYTTYVKNSKVRMYADV
ncbi:hypothetical protein ACS0TY_003941 [Phlomoides rotata]